MGYEDPAQQGLRPGRSTGKLAFDQPAPNNNNTAYSGGGSYRASGAVSPNYAEPAAAPSTAMGSDAISQYTAPQFIVPKQPGLASQAAGLALTDVASKGIGKAVSTGIDYLKGTSNPATYGLVQNSAGVWGEPAAASAFGNAASNPATYGLVQNSAGVWGEPAAAAGETGSGLVGGLQTAGLAYGAGKVATALGANKQFSGAASGATAGFMIGGPVGGVIGAVVGAVKGGSVVCTELVLHGDATLNSLCRETLYAKTLPNAVLRGYRVWAVPLVRAMRKHTVIYKLIRPVAKRFMQESAARIGFGKQTFLGRIAMPIGLSVCWMIGQVVGETEYKSLYVKGL